MAACTTVRSSQHASVASCGSVSRPGTSFELSEHLRDGSHFARHPIHRRIRPGPRTNNQQDNGQVGPWRFCSVSWLLPLVHQESAAVIKSPWCYMLCMSQFIHGIDCKLPGFKHRLDETLHEHQNHLFESGNASTWGRTRPRILSTKDPRARFGCVVKTCNVSCQYKRKLRCCSWARQGPYQGFPPSRLEPSGYTVDHLQQLCQDGQSPTHTSNMCIHEFSEEAK